MVLMRSQMEMVIDTRFVAISLMASSLDQPKKELDMAPKIWLIEAFEGSVTFITWKWRLARLGMSFLPAPGWSMAPRMSTSTMPVNSPGLSRL